MLQKNKIVSWVGKRNSWIFPIVCILIFAILCILQISGSSVGNYRSISNPGEKDSALLFGNPQPIRSDEWVVNTPLTYAQQVNGFLTINKNIGTGQDMSLAIDAPYKDWSTVFRPQNAGFLFLPFGVAFAARWWLPLLALLIGSYLLLKILIPSPKNTLLSVLLAIAFSLSPFLMWWFSSGTLLPVAYMFLLIVVFVQLINTYKLANKILYTLCIIYFATCLVLTMYVPFIIAAVFAGAFIVLGYIFSQKNPKRYLTIENILLCVAGAVFTLGIVGIFYLGHKEAIGLLQNTVYPGHRAAESGSFSVQALLNLYTQPLLQNKAFVAKYLLNQSELSNFFYLFPYLLIAVAYQIVRGIRQKKNDWFLLFVTAGITILLLRLFAPGLQPLFKLIQLNKVPNSRLLIGLGMLSFMLLVAVIRNIRIAKEDLPKSVVALTGVLTTVILAIQLSFFHKDFPQISRNIKLYIAILSISIVIMVVLFLRKKTIIFAAAIFLLISLSMAYSVNPLYKGYVFENDQLIKNISEQNTTKPGTWVVLTNIAFEHFPQMAGVHTISGVMTYPEFGVWKDFPNLADNMDTINRFAHISFQTNGDGTNSMVLKQPDNYVVSIDPCSSFAQTNITYLVSFQAIPTRCLVLSREVQYNKQPVFIYQLVQNTTQ